MGNLVSIILCCYNSSKYLPEAIQSVLSQEHNDFELIFVNDGSTDNSLSIAESFAKKDSRIKIFSRPNGGLNSARNFGAQRISENSEALLFFDADDLLDKSMIGSLYHELKSETNIGAAYCDYKKIDENGDLLKKPIKYRRLIPTKYWVKELPAFEKVTPFFSIYSWSSMGEPWTLIKKELFFKYGGWDEINFPKGDTYGESIALFSTIALNHKVIFLDKELYFYRSHSNQITSTKFNNCYIQNKIDRIMLEREYENPQMKEYVQRVIRINKYRVPLFKYLTGPMKYDLRYTPLIAFKNLIFTGAQYIYSLQYGQDYTAPI